MESRIFIGTSVERNFLNTLLNLITEKGMPTF